MTCLPSSSPCQRPTDWPVSETMWCFSFTSTRDGTRTQTPTPHAHSPPGQTGRFTNCKPSALSLGSIQWTKQESMNMESLMTKNPKGRRTRTKGGRPRYRPPWFGIFRFYCQPSGIHCFHLVTVQSYLEKIFLCFWLDRKEILHSLFKLLNELREYFFENNLVRTDFI